MMPFINWARSAGGGLVDKDLPAPIGDCALTVTTRSKATTVSGGASLELDIAVEIMPRGGDLIPFGLTIPSWNFSPSATTALTVCITRHSKTGRDSAQTP